MSKLSELIWYELGGGLDSRSVPDAEKAIKKLFKEQAELWRDEEYIPIDEFLAQIEKM